MYTSTSLIRVPLTLALALAFHLSMTPPGQPDPIDTQGEKENRTSSSARVVVLALTKGIYWATTLSELSPHISPLHLTLKRISASLPTFTFSLGPMHDHIPIITGTALAITGTLLRLSAQRALGRFYAYRRPRPGHALITDGPYSVLRHPGYAGLAMCTIGVMIVHFGAATGASTIRWGLGDLVGVRAGSRISPVWIALAGAVVGTVGAVRRIEGEEEVLQETFKRQWDDYAARVRFRLIPGVY